MKKFLLYLLIFLTLISFTSCKSEEKFTTQPRTISGIDDDDFFVPLNISSVNLSEEGKVTLTTSGELKEKFGEEYVLPLDKVVDIYVLPYGNGGYRCIMMINSDGTISAVDSSKLINDKEIVIMDDFEYKDIVSLEYDSDIDGQMIYAVDSYGGRHMVVIY